MRMNNSDRNAYVRQQLKRALLELLRERELRDITIGELAETAQVSRVSVYRNYSDKEDILRDYISVLLFDWKRHAEILSGQERGLSGEALCTLFDTMKENGDLFLLLKQRGLLYLLRSVLQEIFGPKPEQDNFPAYYASFIYNGLYGWVEEWIARGMQESSDQMITLMQAAGQEVH